MATFATSQKYETTVIRNPRHGRVILWSDTEMKTHLEKSIIEQGSFGTVYSVKGTNKDKPEYVIKEFKTKDELYRTIFDNEVQNGRICHPFINPVIARAEHYEPNTGEHISYFMYPYMKNGNLRHNIDREKKGECLWSKETNSRIWTRCVYQIFQVMNYLHRPVESVRGPIFLRYLTSCSIFLDENFNVKIGDFGVAMEAELKATKVMYSETAETGYYPAQNIEYTASCDIFSAGVVILEILTGENAKLMGDPKFLYQKYTCEGGEQDLMKDSRKWPDDNGRDLRDKLAVIAVNAISSAQTMDFFLKKLDDLSTYCLSSLTSIREGLTGLPVY